MTRYLISTILVVMTLGLGSRSHASPSACSYLHEGGKTPVVFFGGHGSTDDQVQSWAVKSAMSDYTHDYTFEGTSLHGAESNQVSVEAKGASDIQNCVSKIRDDKFKGPVKLVFHSDGALAARKIMAGLTPDQQKKVECVNLDGSNIGCPKQQCWTAYSVEKQGSTQVKSCKDIKEAAKSAFTNEMVKCGDDCHVLPVKGCTNPYCLHFRLVNLSPTNPEITKDNYPEHGYDNEKPFLDFLTKSSAVVKPAPQVSQKDGIIPSRPQDHPTVEPVYYETLAAPRGASTAPQASPAPSPGPPQRRRKAYTTEELNSMSLERAQRGDTSGAPFPQTEPEGAR